MNQDDIDLEERERHFAALCRLWQQAKVVGKPWQCTMRSMGRKMGFTNREIDSIKQKTISKVWKGITSDDLMARIKNRDKYPFHSRRSVYKDVFKTT